MTRAGRYILLGILIGTLVIINLMSASFMTHLPKSDPLSQDKTDFSHDELFLFHPILKNYQTRRLLAHNSTEKTQL